MRIVLPLCLCVSVVLGGCARPAGPDAALPKGVGDMLRAVAKLIVMDPPKDARWVHVTYKRMVDDEIEEAEVGGWLLGEDKREFRILDYFGWLRHFDKSSATVAPRTLLAEAKALAAASEKLAKLYQRDGDDVDWRERSRLQAMLLCYDEHEYMEGERLVPTFLSIPEALLAAWGHARGDDRVARLVFVPRLVPARRAEEYLPGVRERLCDHYQRAMLYSFAADHDVDGALLYARHLSKPLFAAHDRGQAVELAQQLATRRGDFKTFTLPTKEQWPKLKEGMTGRQQVEYLAERLRLSALASSPVPGLARRGGAREAARAERRVISPFEELWRIDTPELPALAPFLADRSFVTTLYVDSQRADRRMPVLDRTGEVVARVVNHVAMKELVGFGYIRNMTDDELRRDVDRVLAWCKAHEGKTRVQLVLETMRDTDSWPDFAWYAYVLIQAKHAPALPLLDRRVDDFPRKRGRVVRIMYALDVAEAVPYARKRIRDRDPEVRFWAALILLRHGDKARLEGLDVLRPVLERVKGKQALLHFIWAIDDLIATRREEALKVACLILDHDPLRIDPEWVPVAGVLLRRLFLGGRKECLDYLLAKLDSRHLLKAGWTGDRQVEADRLTDIIEWWRPRRRVPSRDATPPTPEQRRQEIKAWLRESSLLIHSGKTPKTNPEGPFLMTGEYGDPWEEQVMGLGWE